MRRCYSTRWVYKLNNPEFNKVNRSQYGTGTGFVEEFVEYHGQNWFIATSGMCFLTCFIYFTDNDYIEEF